MAQAQTDRIPINQYLANEANSETKHEFVNGEVLAMAGASLRHNFIVMNVTRLLLASLNGGPCRPLGSDQRIFVEETGLFAYPDLTILCGKPKLLPGVRPDTLLNPSIVIEVLSESTETWDRGAKLAHYRRMTSLKEILLINQDEPRVEHFVKQPDGRWLLHGDWLGMDDGPVEFTTVPAKLGISEIYEGVDGEAFNSSPS